MLPPAAEYTLHKPSRAYSFLLAFARQLLSLDGSVLTYMPKPLQQNQDMLCRWYHRYMNLWHRLLPKPTDGVWFVLDILKSLFSYHTKSGHLPKLLKRHKHKLLGLCFTVLFNYQFMEKSILSCIDIYKIKSTRD